MSKRTIKNVQNENALVAGINYYAGYNNKFTIYFVQPEIFLKHYINAKIKPKKGGNEWHIEIKHSKKQLVFVRKDAENVEIPTDKNNYYLQFEMTDDEYRELEPLLGKRKKQKIKSKTKLEIVVKGSQGSEAFSKKSAILIALLSILIKSNKPLTIEDIISRMIKYGVFIRTTNKKSSVKLTLDKLIKIGGINVLKDKSNQKLYSIADDIDVDVVI